MTMPFYAGPDEPDRINLAQRTLHIHQDASPGNPMIFTVRLSARHIAPHGVSDLRVDFVLTRAGEPDYSFSQCPQGRDMVEQLCSAAALLHTHTAIMSTDGRLQTPDGQPFELDHGLFAAAEAVRDELSRKEPPDPRSNP
jgi:hypothetical protein